MGARQARYIIAGAVRAGHCTERCWGVASLAGQLVVFRVNCTLSSFCDLRRNTHDERSTRCEHSEHKYTLGKAVRGPSPP